MSTSQAPVGMSETHAELQRDAIGLPRVVAFTAAFIGPAASIALGLVAAFSFAGFATPFVVLIAFLGALFASNSVAQLAQRLPSAGGLYTYNAVSLGRQAGFVTGWMMTFAYILWVPSGIGATGTFFSQFFHDAFGWSINENVLLVVVLAVVIFLAFRGIATSASVDLIVLTVEVLVIVALAVTILGTGARASTTTAVQPLSHAEPQVLDITLAMVYTVVIFTGFESGAVLGEESTSPRRTIPRGIFGAVILVGLFYLLVSYSESQGVAPKNMAAFAANPAELTSDRDLLELELGLADRPRRRPQHHGLRPGGLQCGNADAVRHGTRADAPPQAVLTIEVQDPARRRGDRWRDRAGGRAAGLDQPGRLPRLCLHRSLSGLSLIIIFISVSVAVIVAFQRQFRADFNPILHLVLPVLGIVTFSIPLIGTFYPSRRRRSTSSPTACSASWHWESSSPSG